MTVPGRGLLVLAVAWLGFLGVEAGPVPLQVPRTHGGLMAFGFAPDGRVLAGGTGAVQSVDGTQTNWVGGGEVVLWNAGTGRLEGTLGSHKATVRWVGFSRDGSRLGSASPDNRVVRTWDVAGRKALAQIQVGDPALASGPGLVPLCALSPDGRRIATVGARVSRVGANTVETPATLTMWDATTGKVLWTVPDSGVGALGFDAEGTRLVVMARKLEWMKDGDAAVGRPTEGRIEAWEAGSGRHLFRTEIPAMRLPTLLLSPAKGEEMLAVGSRVGLWVNVRTGARVREQKLPEFRSPSVARLSEGGDQLALVEASGENVHLVDLATGTGRVVHRATSIPLRLLQTALSPDLHHVVAPRGPGVATVVGF